MANEPLQQAGAATGTTYAPDEFSALLQKEFKPTDEARANRIEQAVQTLAQQALADANVIGDDVFLTLDAIRAALDRKLTEQVNKIIHHSEFQQLESAWRGLQYLVMNTSTGKDLKIRVLNIGKDEARKMFRQFRDAAWDQSPLFKKVYELEFGQLGGQPYGALVCDYAFDHSAPDLEVMKGLSKIGAAAHAPVIAAAAPPLMGMESWQELANPRDLGKLFDATDYAAWRSFRETSDSRYLALTMPRFLGRQVYGAKTEPVEEFDFEEDTGGKHDQHLWVNAAYAMGVRITDSFATYGWVTRIRGVELGGTVEGLPTAMFPTDDGGVDMKCPTEIAISDRREAELSKSGLMALIHRKNTDQATFIGGQTVHNPAKLRRSGGDRQCQPLGAAALHLRQLPLRPLPQMHGPRLGRRHPRGVADRAGPVELDQPIRRRQPRDVGRGDQGAAPAEGCEDRDRSGRRKSGLLQGQVPDGAALPARRHGCGAEHGFATSEERLAIEITAFSK